MRTKKAANCKHDWTTHTTSNSDYKCSKCGRLGKLVWREDAKNGRRQVVRANQEK